MKQGGTADSVNIRPWQRIRFSARDFRVYYEPLRREVPRLAGKLSHRKENNHEDQPISGCDPAVYREIQDVSIECADSVGYVYADGSSAGSAECVRSCIYAGISVGT